MQLVISGVKIDADDVSDFNMLLHELGYCKKDCKTNARRTSSEGNEECNVVVMKEKNRLLFKIELA